MVKSLVWLDYFLTNQSIRLCWKKHFYSWFQQQDGSIGDTTLHLPTKKKQQLGSYPQMEIALRLKGLAKNALAT